MTLPFDYSPWKDKKNWLVAVAVLGPSDDPDNVECLDWIGRLFAFASVTNARMLAVRGHPSWPTYELWFSFTDDNQKRRFLNLVRDDGYADPDDLDDGFSPPDSLNDLPDLRPASLIFAEDQEAHIRAIAETTMAKMMASGISAPWDSVN
jgi:hypothetical protein